MNTSVVPAHIAARQLARKQNKGPSLLSAVLGSGGYAAPKISIRAGRYRLVEDGVETVIGTELDVVVVGVNPKVSKVFYDRPYDGSENVRPACSSMDGVRPDATIESPVSKSCLDCPHNVLGSKILPSGAKSKLCSDQRHIAVVPAADPNKVYGLTITVSAMTNLREYFKELQNNDLEVEEVVTQLGFDDKVSFPKVTFSRKGYVPEKAMGRINDYMQSDDVKEAIRLIPPRPRDAVPALAAPAVAAPVVEEEAPAPAPAPAKAAKPKTEPVKASSELESKLDSLFDE